MPPRWLTALPVYNEVKFVLPVLAEVGRHGGHILVIDDGSTDGTAELLATVDMSNVEVLTHERNRGYGAALRSAFRHAIQNGFETLVTIDCDGQHEPQRIPRFVAGTQAADIVSGSRYLRHFDGDDAPPAGRRWINQRITAELNRRLRLRLTDAFCGFKAYRVAALKKLRLTEDGYAMPLELWVQAAHHQLKVVERPVPLIYLDEKRSFGGMLDDAGTRIDYYHRVLDSAMEAIELGPRPAAARACGEGAG